MSHSQTPSRPLSTPLEGTMDAEDVSILQYSYSQSVTLTASLIRQIAVEFGLAIAPASLRHAILAYAASRLPAQYFARKFEFHKVQARRRLIFKLQPPNHVVDADVFASHILAWVALCQNSRKEALVHARGCISMMNDLLPARVSSNLLTLFAPLILDHMNIVLASRDVPTTTSSFAQRVPYYRELCRTGAPSEAWQSPLLETTYQFVRGAICVAAVTLKNIAIKEKHSIDIIERLAAVKFLAQYIHSKLEDDGFQNTFTSLAQGLGNNDLQEGERTPEQQLFEYQSIGKRSLEFVLAVIEGSTILQGLSSPKATTIAATIRSQLRSAGRPGEALRYCSDAYYCHISLSALVLIEEDERNL